MPGVLELAEAAAISSQDVPSQAASFQPDSMQATQQADTAPLVSPSGTQRAAAGTALTATHSFDQRTYYAAKPEPVISGLQTLANCKHSVINMAIVALLHLQGTDELVEGAHKKQCAHPICLQKPVCLWTS